MPGLLMSQILAQVDTSSRAYQAGRITGVFILAGIIIGYFIIRKVRGSSGNGVRSDRMKK